MNAAKATCTTTALTVGSHSIVATYGGDTNNAGSVSPTLTQTVNSAANGTTLASSSNPATVGASVTFTATVTGSNPTGSVKFTDGGNPISGCYPSALNGSGNVRTATCSTSDLSVGNHNIVANYGGDAANVASASAPLAQDINFPTNNNPNNEIRFNTPAGAFAKQQQLIAFIWSSGLPTTQPAVIANIDPSVFNGDLSGIDKSLVAQVSQLDANVSGFGFFSVSYLLRPVNQANVNRFVLVHHGHWILHNNLQYGGVAGTINALLQKGFSVCIMQMPLFGWNTDETATVPGQGTLTYSDHDEIITTTGPPQGGMGLRLFLEPIVQNINYFATLTPSPDVSMLGVSGGGWTTHLAAAIDSRIHLSIPIAGSAPLYIRNQDPASVGDTEQWYLPLYAEDIAVRWFGRRRSDVAGDLRSRRLRYRPGTDHGHQRV